MKIFLNNPAPVLSTESAMLRASDARGKIVETALNPIVLKRVGRPEDPADVISFPASDKARHITGELIKVDGGHYTSGE